MMDEYKTYMSNINDKDLLIAFEECQSCRETGILPAGKARSIMNKWKELSGSNTFSATVIMQEISTEMAKRYYELKKMT